jgi:hypothetical protein
MRAVAVVLALVTWLPARADVWPDSSYKALPCRPTIGCTADIVPPGVFEIELGYLYRRLGDTTHQHSIPFLVKLSLADWVQLQVGDNGFTAASRPSVAQYVDNLGFGFKFHLQDQAALIPSLSLSVLASIALPQQQGYMRAEDLLVTLHVSKDIRWLHVDVNAGLNLLRLDGAPIAQPWIALALTFGLAHGLAPLAELYYFADASPIASSDGGVLVALTCQPRNFIVLDAGIDAGLVQATRAVSAFAGVTIIPLDLWDTRAEKRAKVQAH